METCLSRGNWVFFPDSPVSVFPVIPGKSLVESLQFVRLQVKFVPGNSLNFHNGNMSVTWKLGFLFWDFLFPFSREFPEKPYIQQVHFH
jgi:hypothetical protein